jgi:hypothetical protein
MTSNRCSAARGQAGAEALGPAARSAISGWSKAHSPPLRGAGISGYLRPDLCRSRLIARAALSPCRANSDMAP